MTEAGEDLISQSVATQDRCSFGLGLKFQSVGDHIQCRAGAHPTLQQLGLPARGFSGLLVRGPWHRVLILKTTNRLRILKGSWDLVSRVITKVTILIITYNRT